MLDLNFVDYIIITIATISTIIGINRGFIKEIFSVITWVVGVYLGYSYAEVVGQAFSSIKTVLLKQIIGGSIIFFLVLILGGLLSHLLVKIVRFTGLSFFDKCFGGLLGVIRGAIIVLVLVPLLAHTAAQEEWWKKSALVPEVLNTANKLVNSMPEKWINSLNEWTENLTG